MESTVFQFLSNEKKLIIFFSFSSVKYIYIR